MIVLDSSLLLLLIWLVIVLDHSSLLHLLVYLCLLLMDLPMMMLIGGSRDETGHTRNSSSNTATGAVIGHPRMKSITKTEPYGRGMGGLRRRLLTGIVSSVMHPLCLCGTTAGKHAKSVTGETAVPDRPRLLRGPSTDPLARWVLG